MDQGSKQWALFPRWLGHSQGHMSPNDEAAGADAYAAFGPPGTTGRVVWSHFTLWPAPISQTPNSSAQQQSSSSLAPACLTLPSAPWTSCSARSSSKSPSASPRVMSSMGPLCSLFFATECRDYYRLATSPSSHILFYFSLYPPISTFYVSFCRAGRSINDLWMNERDNGWVADICYIEIRYLKAMENDRLCYFSSKATERKQSK